MNKALRLLSILTLFSAGVKAQTTQPSGSVIKAAPNWYYGTDTTAIPYFNGKFYTIITPEHFGRYAGAFGDVRYLRLAGSNQSVLQSPTFTNGLGVVNGATFKGALAYANGATAFWDSDSKIRFGAYPALSTGFITQQFSTLYGGSLQFFRQGIPGAPDGYVTIAGNNIIDDAGVYFAKTTDIPTSANYITTNTNQTGLTGDKSNNGVWTFNQPITIANQSTTPSTPASGYEKIYFDNTGRFSYINPNGYTRTLRVTYPGNALIQMPYLANPILLDSVQARTLFYPLSGNPSGFLTSTTGVSSITGTANQVIASSSTGAVTLSLSQSLGTTNSPNFAGLGLGSTKAAGDILTIGGAITGSTNAAIGNWGATVSSGVTNSATGLSVTINTAAATFTLPMLIGVNIPGGTIGSGSTVSEMDGMFVRSSFVGATNVYGIRTAIPAATNRWGFYNDGGANSANAGQYKFGSTAVPAAFVDIAGGNATQLGLKLNSQALLTTTVGGAIENDGNHLYYTPVSAGTRYQLDRQLFQSATVVSSAATLTLSYGTQYVFAGTTTTWTLPAIVAANNTAGDAIYIKNRGSGNITLNSNTGSQIYDTAAVSSITIAPGSSVTLRPDGTFFDK